MGSFVFLAKQDAEFSIFATLLAALQKATLFAVHFARIALLLGALSRCFPSLSLSP